MCLTGNDSFPNLGYIVCALPIATEEHMPFCNFTLRIKDIVFLCGRTRTTTHRYEKSHIEVTPSDTGPSLLSIHIIKATLRAEILNIVKVVCSWLTS